MSTLTHWDSIRGTGDGTEPGFASRAPLVGVSLAPQTYLYRLPCADEASLVVTLKPHTVTGACTARIYTTLADEVTIDSSIAATSIALSAGSQNETTIAVTGEAFKILELVVPGGGLLLFDVAEFRTIIEAASGGGGGGGGGAATVADGADVTQGAVADAAVATDANGTVNAHIRGLVKILADVYTSASHWLKVQLQAGENHVGEVGGNTIIIAPTVTVTASAYSAGFSVGGLLTLTGAMRKSGGSGVLQSLLLSDHANQKAALELLVFDSNPSASTFTDHSAAVIDDADVAKIIRRISIGASDYVSLGSTPRGIADVGAIGKVVVANGAADLYAALVAVGAPTYAATSDLKLHIGFMRD